MVRTQVYIPDDTHATLTRLARKQRVSLSHLIREGAQEVIKKNYKGKTPQQEALEFFANIPDEFRVKLSDSAENLIRKDRD